MCSNKSGQLDIFLREEDPDIFCMSEHGLNEDDMSSHIIEGYNIAASFCRQQHKCGGVAIYAKTNIEIEEYMEQDKLSIVVEGNVEFAITRVKYEKNQQLIIIVLYRPPSGSLDTFFSVLNMILAKGSLKKKDIVICGDINIDVLIEGPARRRLNDTLNMFGQTATINTPTRTVITKTTATATAIDNIITNVDRSRYKTEVIVSAISDHDAQSIEIKPREQGLKRTAHEKSSIRYTYFRDMSQDNVKEFYSKLLNEGWEEVYEGNGIEDKYSNFIKVIKAHYNSSFPTRRVRVKAGRSKKISTLWITQQVLEMRNKVIKWATRQKTDKDLQTKVRLERYKKAYKGLIKEAKAKSAKNFIKNSNNKSKAIWQIINKERTNKNNDDIKPIKLKVNGETLNNTKEVAGTFNTYFAEAASKLLEGEEMGVDRTNYTSIPESGCNFILNNVTSREIIKLIRRMKNKKSLGPDGISSHLIKQCGIPLAEPLAHLINDSFSSGVFPSELKVARVKPIFKKGDSMEMGNYRPISNLNAFSKIFEMAMNDRITKFFEINNLLAKDQHGFRKGRSTETAIGALTDEILSGMDNRKYVLVMFMDLSKAFDCVKYDILINKLYSYGIRGIALQWIYSYLHGRRQFVNLVDRDTHMEVRSGEIEIKIGVPQGSILGPTFFNVQINDMPQSTINGQVILYADDSTALLADTDLSQLEINGFISFSEIAQWLKPNNLILNIKKTNCMIFQTGKKTMNQHNINICTGNGAGIEQVESTETLGIHLDEYLTWDVHIDHLARKISSSLYVFRKLRVYKDQGLLKTVYYSLIETYLSYAIIVWGNSSKKNTDRLFVLQKRAVRMIANLKIRESCRGHFKKLNIMTLPSLYMYKTILYLKQHKTDTLKNNNVHKHNTRGRKDMYMPPHNLSMYEKGPTYAGIVLYNRLPDNVKDIDLVEDFKGQLKKFFIDQEFYTVDEYLKSQESRSITR